MQIYKVLQFPSTSFILFYFILKLFMIILLSILQATCLSKFNFNKSFIGIFPFVCKDLIYY